MMHCFCKYPYLVLYNLQNIILEFCWFFIFFLIFYFLFFIYLNLGGGVCCHRIRIYFLFFIYLFMWEGRGGYVVIV